MAEEIDLEKCNFQKLRSLVTLTLDRVEVILVRISGRGLPAYQIRSKSELAAMLRGSRPGVQSASLIMTSLMTS